MAQDLSPAVAPELSGTPLPSSAHATRARFGVLAFLCTLAMLLYVDRVCIGQAESHIRNEFGLTKTQMGWVFTVFSLAYALFEVPIGHWGDRYGGRGIIARIVVCWSVFTALTGATVGFTSLLVVRFLFGAGEAGAYPNTARVVTRWFPLDERGKVRGVITFVSLLGGVVAPIVSALLIRAVGWRMTFAVFGMLGVIWAALFYRWFRDDPAKHPRVNTAELARIRTGADVDDFAKARAVVHDPIPWKRVLSSPNVWLLGFIMTVSGALFYMQFQWYPTYLKEARGQGEIAAGWLTAVVMMGGAMGCLAGGWLSDAVIRRRPERKWSRRFCGGGALLMAGVCAFGIRSAESTFAITLWNAAALFFMQTGTPTWWAVVAETSGRHGAALWGLMNSLASLGMIGINVFVGWLVEHRQRAAYTPTQVWGPVFDTVGAGLLAGAVCWLIVDATRSSVEPPAAPAAL